MMDFSSKTAIVTGAASGIGFAMTVKLLEKGAKVLMADINVDGVQDACDKLKEKYGAKVTCTKYRCDVTKIENIKKAFDECEQELGKANILVNNAGGPDGKNFRKTMELNLEAPVNGTEIAIEYMGKHNGGQGGNVINLASMAGIKSVPFAIFYSATKTGLVSYTRNIGHPFNSASTGVNVQCLCPGAVDTPLLKSGPDVSRNEQSYAAAMKYFTPPFLQPKEVATALIQLLQDGKPGAVMCIEYGKPTYYHEI